MNAELSYSWSPVINRPCRCLRPHPGEVVRISALTLHGVVRIAARMANRICPKSEPEFNNKPNPAQKWAEVRQLVYEGWTAADIIDMTGYTGRFVHRVLYADRFAQRTTEIESLLEAGYTIDRIVEMTGISRAMVARTSRAWRAAREEQEVAV